MKKSGKHPYGPDIEHNHKAVNEALCAEVSFCDFCSCGQQSKCSPCGMGNWDQAHCLHFIPKDLHQNY